MLILIEGAEVYTPDPLGKTSVLLDGGSILKVGAVDRRAVDALGVECEVINGEGCIVTPGLIDPHEHLLGGSGEDGFSMQSPEITLGELVQAGITTVVGCLGVDTTMKTMAGLLGRVKGLREQGLTAYCYSGGYNVPPTSILHSVRDDILFVAEILGAGEIAIADERATDPQPYELARLVNDAHVGGMLSQKAGITHLHVGNRKERLKILRTLVDDFEVDPSWLYPTHVQRSEALMKEAIDLAERGATIDIDVVESDLPRWLGFYREQGGDLSHVTISTDASLTSPQHLLDQLRTCIVDHGYAIEDVLPQATVNTARVLKLTGKGRLQAGKDADALMLTRDGLDLVEVIAGGNRLFRDGQLQARDRFVENSDREIHLGGNRRHQKAPA